MTRKFIIAIAVFAVTATATETTVSATDFIEQIANRRIRELVLELAEATKTGNNRKARYIRSMIRTEKTIITLGKEG